MRIEYDDDFRQRWSKRRELAVSIVGVAIAEGGIESEFERLKVASGYERLSQRDQASFRRFCSDLRTVWNNWHKLTAEDRFEFLNGRIVYSTLANEIRAQFA